MALSIDIAANTTAAQRGVKDLSKALDATADALDDVARDSKTAANTLETSFRGMGSDATEAGDKVQASFRDMVRDAGKAERAVEGIGKSSGKSMGDAADNIGSFKDEAKSNFAEVAASFDGSVSSMADGVQGLTGGLATALTPGIGIPLAILGAAAGAFLASWQTDTEASAEEVEAMYTRMTEAGSAFLSKSQVAEAVKNLDTEQVALGMERAAQYGLDAGAVINAMVGDTEALALINAEMVTRRNKELDLIRDSGRSIEDQQPLLDAVNLKYAESTDWIRAIQGQTDTAADKWAAVDSAVKWANESVKSVKGSLDDIANTDPNVPLKVTVDRSDYDQFVQGLKAIRIEADVVLRPGQRAYG